nr:MAG TPA: ASCH domain protein [Caudoviricetes sp.]
MKKIMFNDKYGLTQAVFDGRKTMTRRIANTATDKQISLGKINKEWYEDEEGNVYISAYYIGEVIAISQNYKDAGYDGHSTFGDSISIKSLPGWTNKMFVKAEYMPHHIKITDARLELLQDISDKDCLQEGIREQFKNCGYGNSMQRRVFGYVEDKGIKQQPFDSDSPKEAFAMLIDRISGYGTWENNPFVWVYEFELID